MARSNSGILAGCVLALSFVLAATGAPAQQASQKGASSPASQGALAPANLAKSRSKPPFNLTGTWMVDLSAGFAKYMFGPPYPKFKPAAEAAFEKGKKAVAEHQPFQDDIGQCFPAGMPMIMTRVWPLAMIQLPTAIYMVSGFENGLRIVYLDGRPHTPADVVVRSYNGDSIGHWEGDTLVVDTTSMTTGHHWVDSQSAIGEGIPVSDEFHIVERIRMINGGKTLEIHYIMTDPQNWEGEWSSTKQWNRVDDTDITEVECTPDLNTHLLSTHY